MNRCLFFILMLLMGCGCANKEKRKNITQETDSVDVNAYFNNHSSVLIFSFNETNICDNCVMQILDRLSYLKIKGIRVFIDGISDEARSRFMDFEKMPLPLKHTINELPAQPFVCIVDSSFIASHYFVPELDKPQLFEAYLKEILPLIEVK